MGKTEDERTYFCSELIAKAFKAIGILQDDDTACSKFYPNHFSARGDSFLNMEQGNKMSEEMQIIIDI